MNTSLCEALLWQVVAGLVGSVAVAAGFGAMLALSLAYGVLLAILSGFFLANRVGHAGKVDQVSGQRLLYTGAALRFVGVLAALLLAYKLGLHLLAVAGGMLLAQVALFIYAAQSARKGYVKTGYKTQTRDGE